MSSGPGGSCPGPRPDEESLGIIVATANCNSWGSLRDWIPSVRSAHIILVQEHHLEGQDCIGRASKFCLQHGWKSLWEPAVRTTDGGTSGGVAILARTFMGLHQPRQIFRGRALGAVAHLPGGVPFALVSVYGFDTEGLTDRQLDLHKSVGAHLFLEGSSFVVGGDFNLEPSSLKETGFQELARCELVSTGAPTCFGAKQSEYDYFLVSGGLARGVKQVRRCDESEFSPHFVIELEFYPALCRLQALGFRKPPPLPAEAPPGMGPPPGDFGKAHGFLEMGERALRSQDANEVQRLMSRCYKEWANLSEGELVLRLGEEVPYLGARGKDPQVLWKPILQDDSKSRRYPELRAIRWFCARFRALAQLLPSAWAGLASSDVVKLMGELADDLHFLRLDELGLQPPAFGTLRDFMHGTAHGGNEP